MSLSLEPKSSPDQEEPKEEDGEHAGPHRKVLGQKQTCFRCRFYRPAKISFIGVDFFPTSQIGFLLSVEAYFLMPLQCFGMHQS